MSTKPKTSVWYRISQFTDMILAQEMSKTTDKTVTTVSGRRENIQSEYHTWYPTALLAAGRLQRRLEKTVRAGKEAEKHLQSLTKQIKTGKIKVKSMPW